MRYTYVILAVLFVVYGRRMASEQVNKIVYAWDLPKTHLTMQAVAQVRSMLFERVVSFRVSLQL